MVWSLLARSSNHTIAGVVSGWSSLKLTLRVNQVGSWQLDIPREATPAGWPAPGSGLIILRDRAVVASGVIDEDTFAWSADPNNGQAGPGTYTLAGDTDLARLGYRLIYPDPSAPWNRQDAAYWTYPAQSTDTAEQVMRHTVAAQAGALAHPDRQVPGLVLGAPTGAGGQVRIRERFGPLLAALRSVARAGGGLVFDVTDTLNGEIAFTVRAPTDRTRTARFGIDVGNLASLTVRRIAPKTTLALVAGPGTGTGRELVEVPDHRADSAWGRREAFLDQRHTGAGSSPGEQMVEYRQAAAELFDRDGEQTAVAATVLDTPTVAWGHHYRLGDLVTIQTPYGPVTDLVRQADIEVDATGAENITSVIGSTDPATDDPLAATVRVLTERLNRIETGP